MMVTTVQYLLESLSSWKSFETKIEQCVKTAADKESALILFPEYLAMELVTLFPPTDIAQQFEKLQTFLPQFLDFFKRLAKKYELSICTGTFPVKEAAKFRNRAFLIAPSGSIDFQDKLQLTQAERQNSVIERGNEIKVFRLPEALIGISICYDSEFPPICRKQVEAGAELILVPSCTISEAGFYRVHISSRARAIENQCYVITSTTLGPMSWGNEADQTVGSCGIFCPADVGFPTDGILCKGCEKPLQDFCHEALNFDLLKNVRKAGNVLNHEDWKYLPRLKVTS
ncbi:MAG TPA: carbon-nitrogen hydrolase family protein [Rhabdochlamydiaceae bacterium]|nr:carbon-nitrogen hydrolase family protein [Rhabdochlamydiaceae bacterium]